MALTKVVVLAEPFQLTTAPLTNPAPLTVRVKAAEPAVAAEGAREVMEGTGLVGTLTLMVAPLPVTVVAVPSIKAPTVLVTDMGTDELLLELSVGVTTAAIPLAIVWVFTPTARHVVDPVPALHVIVLPAAVNAGPAVTPSEATSAGEYERVHCRPAGATVVLRERFNDADPP